MTKRDFFILLVRVFGLYWVISSLFSGLTSNLVYADYGIAAFMMVIIVAAFVVGLFVLLIFKSEKIVTLLKLEKGFDDERIEFGALKSKELIKIATLIIGGILLVNNIPSFLSQAFFAFKNDVSGFGFTYKDQVFLVISGLNILLGYLLLTNYEFVAEKLGNKKEEDENTHTT